MIKFKYTAGKNYGFEVEVDSIKEFDYIYHSVIEGDIKEEKGDIVKEDNDVIVNINMSNSLMTSYEKEAMEEIKKVAVYKDCSEHFYKFGIRLSDLIKITNKYKENDLYYILGIR